MTTKTPRQEEIVQVALELINQKGIQGLTIKNLSKKIGISEPAIYRHYDNKIDILIAILNMFKENTENLFMQESRKDKNAIEKIEDVFEQHFSSFAKTPTLVAVLLSDEIFKGEPQLNQKVAEIITKNTKILTEIVQEGQQNSEIRDDVEAGYLTVIIMGSLRLFVKKWQFTGYSFNIKTEGRKLLESIKRLLQNK